MPSVLSVPHFHDEPAAYAFLESKVWPNGPVCPHCGGTDRISKMNGKSTRIGSYKCYQCRSKFTVKVGTVFESSHVPLHIWLQAVALLTASKKGMSSNQLHRTLGVTLKTAWFMSHRIREAMRDGSLRPMGGGGGIVEADETYSGRKADPQLSPQRKGRPYTKRKTPWDTRGRIMPRVTANWTATVSGHRRDGGAGGMAGLTEAALAARRRVERALTAVGPEFGGLLVDFCCFLKGLEDIERERRWPARSAKIVLRLGLSTLARHYGLTGTARGRSRSPAVLHWGADDYRPTIE